MAACVWKPRKPKCDWRRYLTADERRTMAAAAKEKAEWQRLNRSRAQIANRAIQRAKFAALRASISQENTDGPR